MSVKLRNQRISTAKPARLVVQINAVLALHCTTVASRCVKYIQESRAIAGEQRDAVSNFTTRFCHGNENLRILTQCQYYYQLESTWRDATRRSPPRVTQKILAVFIERQSDILAMIDSVCLSLSVTVRYHVEMTQATTMRFSLEGSPITVVSSWLTLARNSKGNIESGGTEWERGRKNWQFLANKSPYLRNGAR